MYCIIIMYFPLLLILQQQLFYRRDRNLVLKFLKFTILISGYPILICLPVSSFSPLAFLPPKQPASSFFFLCGPAEPGACSAEGSWNFSAPGTSLWTWQDRFLIIQTQFSTDQEGRETETLSSTSTSAWYAIYCTVVCTICINKCVFQRESQSATLLSMSFFPTADWSACSRASTNPSHSLSLRRASAPSELTFLWGKKNQKCTVSVSMREATTRYNHTVDGSCRNRIHDTALLQQQLQFLQPFNSR